MEEALREAAAYGDVKKVANLLASSPDVNINSQNPVNKWTALHWACKRNQIGAAKFLVESGASTDLKNSTGQIAAILTTDPTIYHLLTGETLAKPTSGELISNDGFTPGYMSDPSFPSYYTNDIQKETGQAASATQTLRNHGAEGNISVRKETVLKVKKLNDADFIEVELENSNKTYQSLVNLLTEELELEEGYFGKIRKLPNTIIRKDKDVARLADYEELEVIPAINFFGPGGLVATSVHRPNPLNKSVLY